MVLTDPERRMFWKHFIMRRNYATFYAARMDRLATINSETACGTPSEKGFQIDYLIDHGLKEQSTLLDYGCGTASAGVLFIDYLNAGKYIGADISRECLEAGERRIESLELSDKQPRLIHLPGGSLEALQGHSFDIIWAQSVLTHMPPYDIKKLLVNIRKHMHPSGVFYATFAFTQGKPKRRLFKHWYYNSQFFLELANEVSLECELMPDWRHPDTESDKLIKLTLPKS
jgi:SAM-dependent methyltransferase